MGGIAKTTKKQVLSRFKDLVNSNVTRFANRTFIQVGGAFVPDSADREYLTLDMPGGKAAYDAQVGAGQNVVPYQGTLRVTLWIRSGLDRNGFDDTLLLRDGSGLFDIQQSILAATIGSYLPGDGDPILTQALYFVGDGDVERTADELTGEQKHRTTARGVMAIDLGADFHWDLSG